MHMGLKNLRRSLKAISLRKFLTGDEKSRNGEATKRLAWMTPISHGFHVVEHQSFRGTCEDWEPDTVVVQREQIEDYEVWFFGLFDAKMGDGITKYLQSHLFDKQLNKSQISRKSKEALRRAHVYTRLKINGDKEHKTGKGSSASVIVINGEKIVSAKMGDYRAVACRDDVAHEIGKKHQHKGKRHWFLNLTSGGFQMPRKRILARKSSNSPGSRRSKSSDPVFAVERIHSDTEFVILASTGIWDVLTNHEAMLLIRHIEDPQEAAELLAKEAITRMSKGHISCIVIRFD